MGDRYTFTVTESVLNRCMRYSSRGPTPPSVCGGAVTGKGVIPERVRPISGMRCQRTPPAFTAREKCSASMDT